MNTSIPMSSGAFDPSQSPHHASAGASDEDLLLLTEAQSPVFDIVGVWALIYRNRVVMGLIVALALVAGLASILIMPRIYIARASVQIDQQAAKVLGTEETQPLVTGIDAERFLQTQTDIIGSRSMARRVSDKLGLAASDTFLTTMHATGGFSDGNESREDRVLDVLQKNLVVELRPNSRIVGVGFRSRDPQLAASVANTYAQGYMESNIQRKFTASAYSIQFLQNQLAVTKGRLETSERALIDYARSARLIDASAAARQSGQPAAPGSLVTSNLVDLNTSYASAETNRLQAEERWGQAKATPLMSLPEVLQNDAIQRLLQKRAELDADLKQMLTRLRPDHPTVQQQEAQIAEIDRETNAIATSIRDSIRNQFQTAQRQQQAIGGKVDSLKTQTLSEQERTVRYNILSREVETNRQLFDGLLQRYKEVSAESGVSSNNVSLIDNAEPPLKPSSPRPLLNMALALGMGIALAFAYAFARENLADAVTDPRDIESRLGLPLLGVVPDAGEVAPITQLEDPKSDISESYHTIRNALELSSNKGLLPSVLVTSSTKSEGKTTTSYALGRDLAAVGKRVLLVDADMRRPSLHTYFGIAQSERGFSSVLARMVPWREAVVHTGTPGLDLLPTGPLPPDPASLLAGGAVPAFLADVAADYDIVVIDGPPVLALADASQLAAAAAATMFVIQVSGSHIGNARALVARLRRGRAHVIGAVVTKYNAKKAGYGSYSEYAYHYRYDRVPG